MQEAIGRKTRAWFDVRTHGPLSESMEFKPFEIKTLRVEKDGTWRAVRMIEEDES